MISVIGAGPAGCFYASKEKNEDVHIFEEHKEIGKPVACTGILTDSIRNITNIKEDLIVNKIKQFKIVAPNKKTAYIKLNNPDIILDRAKFDAYMLEKAIENNVKLHLNEKFLGYKKANNCYKIKTSKREYETDIIVGADGPLSNVAKSAGIYGDRKFIIGLQARCKFPRLEENTTEIRLGLGEFSWIVPEDDKIARVGVIGHNIKEDYKKLIKECKVIEDQSGIVPLYNPKQVLRKGNVFLIGDAATQVKATTYGGIIYGLIAGKYLAEDKKNYVKNFNKNLKKELLLSLKMRNFMNLMKKEQYNELVDIFQKEENIKILSKYERDFPSKFILRLLIKEKGFWKIGVNVLKNKFFK